MPIEEGNHLDGAEGQRCSLIRLRVRGETVPPEDHPNFGCKRRGKGAFAGNVPHYEDPLAL